MSSALTLAAPVEKRSKHSSSDVVEKKSKRKLALTAEDSGSASGSAPAKRPKLAVGASEVEAAPLATPAPRNGLAFCKEHGMVVTGPPGFECPSPMESFAATPFCKKLLAKFAEAGFAAPTATQM